YSIHRFTAVGEFRFPVKGFPFAARSKPVFRPFRCDATEQSGRFARDSDRDALATGFYDTSLVIIVAESGLVASAAGQHRAKVWTSALEDGRHRSGAHTKDRKWATFRSSAQRSIDAR